MYKFDIDITPSLNGKEIHLEGICEMYTIMQLTVIPMNARSTNM